MIRITMTPGTPVQILSYHPLGRFTGVVVGVVDLERHRHRDDLIVQPDNLCGFVTCDPRIAIPRENEK